MERWRGKVAVITGASEGIGAEISKKLVNAGLHVVGLARNKEKLEKLCGELKNESGRFYPFKTDVTKEEDILKAFRWIEANVGPVHVLLNNAGIVQNTTLIEGSTEMWKKVLDTNVIGLCVATKEAVKVMRKHGVDGHIIHMNSVSGHTVSAIPQLNVYEASKFAVTALTEALRQELNSLQSKIKVSSISPGNVDTEIGTKCDMNTPIDCPTLKVEDIADAALYVLGTPGHVQIHELIIRPVGEMV